MRISCFYIIPLLVGATSPSFVKIKSLDEFNAALDDNDFVIAVFGSKWCGRLCTLAARSRIFGTVRYLHTGFLRLVLEIAKMLPSDLSGVHGEDEVDELEALDQPDNSLVLLKVDGGRKVNGEILAQEGVQGYPAIHLYVRGYKHVFEMSYRTPELLHPWIVFIISHSPIRVRASDGADYADETSGLPIGLVAHLREPEGILWDVINNMGTYADTRVYYTLDHDRTKDNELVYYTAEGLQFPFPSLNANDDPEDVRQAAKMFVDRHTTKRVTLFDPQRVHRYVSGGFPMVVFILVTVDLKGARERLTELQTSAKHLSSTDLWNIWIPALLEIENATEDLAESLWIRLRKDFDADGAADILTVVVPRVASSDVGLWRSPHNGRSQDQLSSVAEAWELFHGVQVMFNQWFGLDTANGKSKLLAYEPFEERKYSVDFDGDDLSGAVGDFVAAAARGEIEPRRLSQTSDSASLVAKEIHPSIEALTTDTTQRFLKAPMGPVKLHLLLVYAPWCVHCLTFVWHILRPLAAEDSLSKELGIFMVDGTANELPRILKDRVDGYPTLLVHDGSFFSSYPMHDTANVTEMVEWLKRYFALNMSTVSDKNDDSRDEL